MRTNKDYSEMCSLVLTKSNAIVGAKVTKKYLKRFYTYVGIGIIILVLANFIHSYVTVQNFWGITLVYCISVILLEAILRYYVIPKPTNEQLYPVLPVVLGGMRENLEEAIEGKKKEIADLKIDPEIDKEMLALRALKNSLEIVLEIQADTQKFINLIHEDGYIFCPAVEYLKRSSLVEA